MQDPHTRTWNEGTIVSKAETPRSYMVQTKPGIVRRNRIHFTERRLSTVKDKKVIMLQVKPNEVPKVPVIQESVIRPNIVKVPLAISEHKSITNMKSEKMESQDEYQEESKRRKRKVKVRK